MAWYENIIFIKPMQIILRGWDNESTVITLSTFQLVFFILDE